MNEPSYQPLPTDLEQTLRGMGGLEAPQELDHRVALSLTAVEPAPEELWTRVQSVLAEEASADVSSTTRILSFRRFAAAAAVMVVLGAGLWMGGVFSGASQGSVSLETLRDQYGARVLVLRVEPSQLSATAQGLAGSLGAPVSGGRSL
jgi:hypothetical protein